MEFSPPNIFIKQTPFIGRGVFAGKDFTNGELIEKAHLVTDEKTVFTGEMKNYIFDDGYKPILV